MDMKLRLPACLHPERPTQTLLITAHGAMIWIKQMHFWMKLDG